MEETKIGDLLLGNGVEHSQKTELAQKTELEGCTPTQSPDPYPFGQSHDDKSPRRDLANARRLLPNQLWEKRRLEVQTKGQSQTLLKVQKRGIPLVHIKRLHQVVNL